MQITIDIPEEQAERFQKQAAAQGLTVDQWLLDLADKNAATVEQPRKGTIRDVFAKVRGIADDLEFPRDDWPDRDIHL